MPGDPSNTANRGRKPRHVGSVDAKLAVQPSYVTDAKRREADAAAFDEMCRVKKALKPPRRRVKPW